MEATSTTLVRMFQEFQALKLEDVREKVVEALVKPLSKWKIPREFWQEVYSLLGVVYEEDAILDAMGLFNYVLDDFVRRGIIDEGAAFRLRAFVEYFGDVLFPRRGDCVRVPSVVAFRVFFSLAYGEAR